MAWRLGPHSCVGTTLFGPRQANLVHITYASSEGSGEPAHSRSLARTSAARSYKQWVKRNFRQKARSLASLNGWACAVKTCHDGMLEDTNSLDGAHFVSWCLFVCSSLTLWSTIFQSYHDSVWLRHWKFNAIWHDTTPSHIILTLGQPVLALPCKSLVPSKEQLLVHAPF